ncbi:hypothetical protein AB0L70_35935 [Kribbella sp. NPDC051952]|uniref:hypothetical protein n=1 Tax=Kribbella sp. NPDC051952 TaxID=3154851 RepID=UPI003439A538
MAQRTGQLPGPQKLRGARIDQCGVQGLGQTLCSLRRDTSAAGGSVPRDLHQVADQIVPLPGQLAPPGTVCGQVGLAQLLAELSEGMDTVRVDTDKLVGQPRRHRRLSQRHHRRDAPVATARPDRLGEPVPGSHELLGRQPVQLDDRSVCVHLSQPRAAELVSATLPSARRVVGSGQRCS